MKSFYLILFLTVTYSISAFSAEIKYLEVRLEDNVYILHADTWVAAPVNVVEQIIRDFENLKTINPYLEESRIVATVDGNLTTVYFVTRTCLVICYEITHVQAFKDDNEGTLGARIIPELSDFRSGWLRWKVSSVNTGSRVIMDTEVVPDFFVPPLIGPYLVKQKMAEIVRATITKLEAKASGLTEKQPVINE